MEFLKKLFETFDWKNVIWQAYQGLRPDLEKKILESESKWDDMGLAALDTLMRKFFGPEEAEAVEAVEESTDA